MWRDAMGREAFEMRHRRVADVAFPQIVWIPRGEISHDLIAGHLREDRRACDGIACVVATDDRGMRHLERTNSLAVDQNMVRNRVEAAERTTHRNDRRVIDVDAIDLTHRRRPDAEA